MSPAGFIGSGNAPVCPPCVRELNRLLIPGQVKATKK